MLALNDKGTVVSGPIDMVLETEKGCWIVDHKSDQIADPVEAFGRYTAQLDAYQATLQQAGHRVLGTAIHWIRRGEIAICPSA